MVLSKINYTRLIEKSKSHQDIKNQVKVTTCVTLRFRAGLDQCKKNHDMKVYRKDAFYDISFIHDH